eukprot:6193074-Pleurochrysis_carterae.AAC.5
MQRPAAARSRLNSRTTYAGCGERATASKSNCVCGGLHSCYADDPGGGVREACWPGCCAPPDLQEHGSHTRFPWN